MKRIEEIDQKIRGKLNAKRAMTITLGLCICLTLVFSFMFYQVGQRKVCGTIGGELLKDGACVNVSALPYCQNEEGFVFKDDSARFFTLNVSEPFEKKGVFE